MQKKFCQSWLTPAMIAVVIFISLSLIIGMNQSVWYDEAYSIFLAQKPADQLIAFTSADVHPPLYYLLLKFWGGLFGFSVLSLRLSSILPMAIAVFLAIFLTKKASDYLVATVAKKPPLSRTPLPANFSLKTTRLVSFLLAFSPMLLRYSFEIRMYALATLISITATLVLFELTTSAKTKQNHHRKFFTNSTLLWLLYAVLVTLGMLTLYYTVVIWLSHLIFLIYRATKTKQPLRQQSFWLAYLFAVLLFLPWLPTAFSQFFNGALAPIAESLNLQNLLGVFAFNLVYNPVSQVGQVLGALLLIFGVILIIATHRFVKSRPTLRQNLVWWLAFLPIIIEFFICLIKPMYVERYLVYFAPFLFIALSLIITSSPARTKFTVLTFGLLFVGLINLGFLGNYNFQRREKPRVSTLATELHHLPADTPIFTASPYEAIELGFYLDHPLYFYAPWSHLGGGYKILDDSPYKVATSADFTAMPKFSNRTCFVHVYYNDAALKFIKKQGFSPVGQSSGTAMKSQLFCQNQKPAN